MVAINETNFSGSVQFAAPFHSTGFSKEKPTCFCSGCMRKAYQKTSGYDTPTINDAESYVSPRRQQQPEDFGEVMEMPRLPNTEGRPLIYGDS
jgi:hypothetical protein